MINGRRIRSSDPISRDSVRNWLDFSMRPRTEDEIREMILNNPNNVCYSYICMKSRLSESFIKELRVLSTELFNKETYTQENFELIKEALDIPELKDRCSYIKNLYMNDIIPEDMKGRINSNMVVRDRLDWRNIIKYQHITPMFAKLFNREINEAKRMYANIDSRLSI